MYIPAHFAETDPEEVAGLIAAFPLAALVAQTAEGVVANHIPLLRQGAQLVGHIALANRLHDLLPEGGEVLAIFRGEDSYISPNWYPTKAEHHRHVPTWNYQVVHVAGRIRFHQDAGFKRRAVALLTAKMEAETNGAAAWRMGDAPRDYLDQMMGMIVGVTIDITGVAAKSKVSQNRVAEDHAGVMAQMEARGKLGLAGRMRRARDGKSGPD